MVINHINHILRQQYLDLITEEFKVHPVCALLGPRQCGKTTLIKDYIKLHKINNKQVHFFDCENNLHLAKLENPLISLKDLTGVIVIDEVQRRKDLFTTLRVLVDEKLEQKFLITGSASRDLVNQSAETLAGRIGYHQVTPFSLSEVINDTNNWQQLWKQGGFPKSFLLESRFSIRWRDEYIKTFLERDLKELYPVISGTIAAKIWRMLAHYHGQIINIPELAQSLDLEQKMLKQYLYFLEGAFMIRLLRPWYNNSKKREVKAYKLYIRDSGILHRLLQIPKDDIDLHPKLGASFEGFALEYIIKHFDVFDDCYFWSIHNTAELDLLIVKDGRKIGFEIKYSDHPKVTSSMYAAIKELDLDHLYVVIPMDDRFLMDNKITCIGIQQIFNL